jgi:hypothetical protein
MITTIITWPKKEKGKAIAITAGILNTLANAKDIAKMKAIPNASTSTHKAPSPQASASQQAHARAQTPPPRPPRPPRQFQSH